MKTIDDLVAFLNVNVKQWQAEIDSYPEAKAKREGAIECVEVIANFLDGKYDQEEEGALVSDTDVEEAAAENTPGE